MKRWLHALAALLGMALAGLIVFLVFGQASQQAANEGDANSTQTETSNRCGTINAAQAFDASSIATAAKNLPPILNERQVEVTPNRDDQKQWFARLYAASGFCLDEIVVAPTALQISISYPDDLSDTQADAFAYNTLTQAFKPPLARSRVTVDVLDGERRRGVVVTSEAWNNFLRGRAALGLDPSMRGLGQFRRKVGYGSSKLRVTGWGS